MLEILEDERLNNIWNSTGGYLFDIPNMWALTPRAVVFVRLKLGEDLTDKECWIIINRLPMRLLYGEFWAAVSAPISSFYNGDWKEYKERGLELRRARLCAVLSGWVPDPSKPPRRLSEWLSVASEELLEGGFYTSGEYKTFIPKIPPLNYKNKYDNSPTEKDVLNSLDEILESHE